jgi:hypothetical protein
MRSMVEGCSMLGTHPSTIRCANGPPPQGKLGEDL